MTAAKSYTATAAGEVKSFTATVRATDGDGAQVDQDVTITVQENVAPTVTVAATGSPSLQPNSSLTLAATATDANTAAGDVLSYLWSVASATGTGATTGDITFGTRTAASTSLTVPAKPAGTKYVIQMTVTDLVNNSVTADYSLFVASAGAATVAAIPALSFPAQSAIDTETLPAGSGGTGALTYSLAAVVASESTTAGMLVGNPLLPQGLVFDATPANRALTGTPTAAAVGVYDMTYTVTDSVDEVAMKSFKLTVTANEAPVFSDAAKAMVEASYSEAASTAIADLVLPAATGGEGDLVYSLTATSDSSTTANIVGGWPAGLVFTASSRTLAGTPTAVDNYSLTYEANDTDSNSASSDTATITFKMVVAADVVPTLTPSAAITRTGYNGLALTTITLPVAGAGNFDLTDSLSGKHAPAGGSATAVTVPANGGAIKLTDAATTATGLTFTPMGASAATITGTPEVNGVFTLTYKVVDGDNSKDDCTGVGTPAGCDTAEVLVTLTVVYPAAAKIKDIADIASLARSTSSTPSTTTVNLYEYFSPTGGLTFAVDSSNEEVLTVAETGGVLTLTATQAGGTSTVMVTASNDTPPTTPRSTTFAVTVTPTTAPVFSAGTGADNIETKWSKGLTVASADVVPLGDYFSDADSGDSATLMYKLVDSSDSSNPEKDTITYQANSTDVLTATITAANPSATPPTVATLTLTGEAKTSADVSITVRATDTGGNSVDGTFAATVTNTLPTLVGSGIGGQTLAIGETTELTLTPYFSDTETSDANLTFSASSSDTAVVKTPTVNSTSKVMTMEVPGGATDKATATITVTATDESGKSLAQTFTATAASRPAFASATPTATLAENAVGSATPVMVTDLTVSGSTDAKSYTLVSVDGQTSGADFGKFAVAAKTGATATTAEVTYKGALEDYETLKALLADCMPDVNEPLKCEPTFVLVIGVTDDTNGLMATTNTTLTVTVTDVNEAPTYVSASQDPSSPTLLEKLAGDNADATADTDDPRLLATLTFADVDASDTSLTYSVASVDPATLGTGNFSVAANSTNPLKAELSFVGAASVISYGSGEGVVESFKVTVRASDDESPNPASVDQEVTVMVLENVAPTVSVAATGSPSLQPNSSLTLAATATDANTAAGDVLSYAWTVASASDGAAIGDITLGTPTAASTTLTVPAKPAGTTYGIQVTVTDLAEQTATADYSLVIVSAGAPILGAVSAMSFPAQFAIETQTLAAASGGIDTLTYSLTAVVASESATAGMLANNLPQGLAFDSTASSDTFLQLSGTPTVAAVGVYDMTYKVVDSVNESSMRTFKLTVTANQAPVFGQAAMDAVAASYNRVASRAIPALVLPVATGGEGDLVYSLTATAGTASNISGGLPAGLAFDADTRTLSGTPTAVDSYSLTYAVNDTDSNSAAGDTATIAFTLVVATDAVPALIPATAVTATGLKDRELTEINLPVAGGGNFGLTDSLSGKHTPVGGSATAVTVDATSGAISLSDGGASGLTFVAMADGAATIKGAPTVAGVFDLDYKVVDGDLNDAGLRRRRTAPSSCDTAMVSVTVTVTDPTLSLAGGNVANAAAVVLEQDLALSVAAITLPRATGDLSNTANISYALTSSQTVNSAGATINNPPVATVAGGAAALAGLTYTADDGSTAGSLAGTPTAAGTWALTYTVTDDNGTTTGAGTPTADDKEASISFTVQVVADSTLTLAALSGSSFNYLDGDTVGADSSTAFALPGITGGNTPIVESLTTTCALSGGSCAADALTTGSNPAPKGLTFAASSGATPAGLTGTFSSPGTYSLTYSVTDTAIGNTATYQTANVADDEEVAFTLVVQANSVPTLLPATAVTSTGLKGRRLTEINLPLTGGGNFGLTDSLSGTHTPVSGSATDVTVDATSGAISLSGGGATGLTFTAMTEGAASISGTPSVTGAFALVYKVVDGDSNTLDCTGANSPSGCDTAMVSVTLTVMDPTLALTGGVADGAAVELEQGVALSVAPIVLPLVTSGESASANLSYSLQSSRTVDSAGAAIGSPTAATVAGGSVALPGLTYTAIAGSTAGRLSGTPSEAGTWTLTYAVTDDNGTTTGASATDDDVVEGISFTVAVVTDSVPNLADARETALSGKTFDYVTGGAVGADASTAFALPGITGGNGAIAESLATACDALSDGICDGDAVTSASNPAPKGLTFAASSGATPAGLTGIFGSTGIYTVTYSLTDTAIANGAYQPADTADAVEVEFTLQVEANAAPSLASTSAINAPGLATREVLITLPVASGGDGDLTDSLAGTHMPVGTGATATAVAVDATSGVISLSGGGTSGLTFNAEDGRREQQSGDHHGCACGDRYLRPDLQGGRRRQQRDGRRRGDGVCDAGGDGSDADAVRRQCGRCRRRGVEAWRGAVCGAHHPAACDIGRNGFGEHQLRHDDGPVGGRDGPDLHGGRRYDRGQSGGHAGGGQLDADLHGDGQQRHRRQYWRRCDSQHQLHGCGGSGRCARSGRHCAERWALPDRRCGGCGLGHGVRAAELHWRQRNHNAESGDSLHAVGFLLRRRRGDHG